MESELEIKAVRLNLPNLIKSLLESRARGPYPKIGRAITDRSVLVPHFLKKPTEEFIDKGTKYIGRRVIVYTQGFDENEWKRRCRERSDSK